MNRSNLVIENGVERIVTRKEIRNDLVYFCHECKFWHDSPAHIGDGCGATGPNGYRCTHHENGEHVARGTLPDSFAEAWKIEL